MYYKVYLNVNSLLYIFIFWMFKMYLLQNVLFKVYSTLLWNVGINGSSVKVHFKDKDQNTLKIIGSTKNKDSVIIYSLLPNQFEVFVVLLKLLNLWITEHESSIQWQDIISAVARYFNKLGHNIKQLECMGIEEVYG